MTDKERTAIAMLRSGSSTWKEAADFLGVSVEEMRRLYAESENKG